MEPKSPQWIVSLDLAGPVPALIIQCDGILARVGDPANAGWFNNPNPPLQTITAALLDLSNAQKACAMRTKGAAQVRNNKEKIVRNLMKGLGMFVQTAANNNPDVGDAVIHAGGMNVKAKSVRSKAELALAQGPTPGTLLAEAKAGPKGKRVFYDWRYSTNGGQAWTQVQGTNDAHTIISGLTPVTTVSVQVRLTMKNVPGDWSPPVSFVVH